MEIQIVPVLICVVISIVLGSLWYGAFFGKIWMKIIGVDESCLNDPVKKKEMQKQAMPLYFIQLVLSFVQIWILSHYINQWADVSGIVRVLPIWLGFIMPTIASNILWSNLSRPLMWRSFLIQAGYYLVSFSLFGLILASW